MRRTYSLVQVALALVSAPLARHWGYELSKQTGVRSGVLYPMLTRMLDKGWVEDGWEDPNTLGGKRPPRRYYQLTDEGRLALGALLREARHDARFAGVIAAPGFPGLPEGLTLMAELLEVVAFWPNLGWFVLVFGFAPGACLRLIVCAYPRDDPRRAELRAELDAVPRLERPLWVAEQVELALFEGLGHRISTARRRHAQVPAGTAKPPTRDPARFIGLF